MVTELFRFEVGQLIIAFEKYWGLAGQDDGEIDGGQDSDVDHQSPIRSSQGLG